MKRISFVRCSNRLKCKDAMIKNISCIFIGIILLVSCHDDDKKPNIKIPELDKKYIEMSGCLGLYDAVTFNVGTSAYIGLGWVNVIGDNLHFYKYTPKYREWVWMEQPFPGKHRTHAVTFAIGGKAYVGLGRSKLGSTTVYEAYDDFFVYDTLTREWEELQFKFPGKPRWGAVAFVIEGKAYVGTGFDGSIPPYNGDYFADFYELDPQKGWKQISDIYYPRYGAIAFVANNLGYVCFGGLYSSTSKQNVQVYDPVSARWKELPVQYEEGETRELSEGADVKSFVLTKDGEEFVYVFGDNGSWGYAPRENIWKSLGDSMGGYLGFAAENKGFLVNTVKERFEAYEFTFRDER